MSEQNSDGYKFPYQQKEIEFLSEYYSSYLHFRGMTDNERELMSTGYLKQCGSFLKHDFRDIVAVICNYIHTKRPYKDSCNDQIYKQECIKLAELFQAFEKDSPYCIDKDPTEKRLKKRTMSEWEAKHEEDELVIDNKHVFNIEGGYGADNYWDYDFEEDCVLSAYGSFFLVAPNKLEYILPGDKIFVYMLNGNPRRKRPRGRWYFWMKLEYSISFMEQIYKRHGVDPALEAEINYPQIYNK